MDLANRIKKIETQLMSIIPERTSAQFQIKIEDLPSEFTDAALRSIRDYVVGLALEIRPPEGVKEPEVCELVGSGTLITWDGKFGILTAEHVISYPKDKEFALDTNNVRQRLRILFVDHPNVFGIESQFLKIHKLAERVSDDYGPDLAVIELPPSPELDTIKAKKSFWNLSNKTGEKLAGAIATHGCIGIAGHPVEDKAPKGKMMGFEDVTFAPGFVGFTGQINYFEHEGFDYLEVDSLRTEANGAPKSYQGVSGGSVWRIPILRRTENGREVIHFDRVTLAGVPFIEFKEETGRIRVRAHGPISIYKKLLSKLVAQP